MRNNLFFVRFRFGGWGYERSHDRVSQPPFRFTSLKIKKIRRLVRDSTIVYYKL